ncbi:hypothetical protein ACTPD5_21005, partial [Clostridioides difficile]|uniref:hypothetical protein n=1 Tax=Clostridioides difficile TaxID=1496 RepID=UPI003F8D8AE5
KSKFISDYNQTHYYPGRNKIYVKLIYDADTKVILGGQVAGFKPEGEGTLAVIIHKEEGEVLPVFTVIGVIAEKGENQEEVKAKY